jgi:sugar phosphate permease
MKNMFYGWWVVLASFLTLFVCIGIGFFSFPVFLKAISDDTMWGVDKLSWAGAISSLAAGVATPVVGYVVDRHGARAVMLPGALCTSISFLLMGKVASIDQMYVLFLFSGLGLSMTTILPTQALVSRWFVRKRGRAMGLVTMGGALGGMVMMPVTTLLIEALGWRDAYGTLGIIIAVVALPLIVFVIRSTPASMGLQVDGESAKASAEIDAAPSVEESGYELRSALRTRSFWLILCASFFGVFAGAGFGLHIINFLSKSDLTLRNATLVWSATTGVSIAGRFLFGYLAENRQKRYFAFGADVVRTASVLLLVLFALGMMPLSMAVAQLVLLYGLFVGCSAVMAPLLISETFGVKSFGKIMGAIGIPYTIGMALGQIVGGSLYSRYDSYVVAFSVFAAAIFLAGIFLVLARPVFMLDGAPVSEENSA